MAYQRCLGTRLAGVLTTLLEMAFAGDKGFSVDLPAALLADGGVTTLGLLAAAFAEEVGLVVEVAAGAAADALVATMKTAQVPCLRLGQVTTAKHIVVTVGGGAPVVDASMASLRDTWEVCLPVLDPRAATLSARHPFAPNPLEPLPSHKPSHTACACPVYLQATSFELEKLQCNPECVAQEQSGLASRRAPEWTLTYEPKPTRAVGIADGASPPVAVIRQEGSNGDREMAAAFFAGGLEPWDVAMSDLVSGAVSLDRFRGVAFVGGFSYADVLGSAKGWAGVLKFNPTAWAQLEAFGAREDTFSLGVCNGCQLMALLGWVPGANGASESACASALPPLEQPRFVHNTSGRFESRFSSVKIVKSPAVLLQGMEGSSLGVWVAHGEGRAHFPQSAILESVLASDLAPLRYVDDDNKPTEAYPFNPNGSTHGIAAVCSLNGRHLAMMPHPERCFVKWQWPWMPQKWADIEAGPWLRLFQNARAFCDATAPRA